MTDQEISTPTEGGAAPSAPSQTPVATSSQALPELETLQKKIGDLEGQVRALQSGKDKATFKLEKQVADLEGVIAQYEELRGEGLSKSRAIREMKLDTLLQQQTGEPVPASTQPAPGSAPAVPTSREVDAVLKALGLDAGDPQVVDVMRRTSSLPEATVAFANLATQRKQAPNPAAVAQVGGGTAVIGEDDLASVQKKLDALKAQPAWAMDQKEYKRLVGLYNQLITKQ